MRAQEFITENDEPISIKLPSNARAKAWIKKVYELYPYTFDHNHVMTWNNDQEFVMFELVPSMTKKDAVEVKWFQAYPMGQGIGQRGMAELQRLAREDGIVLTLYPWDKGQVSRSKLKKFYGRQGFKPVKKGAVSMFWEPEKEIVKEVLAGSPTVGWHITTKEGLADIEYSGGLEPRQPSTEKSYASRPVVYLVTDLEEEFSEVYQWILAKSDDDDPLTVLKINLRGLPLVKESGFWASTNPIPMSRMTNLGDVENIEAIAKASGTTLPDSYYKEKEEIRAAREKRKLAQTKQAPEKEVVNELNIDNRKGWGQTPKNADVDYFGLKVAMKPSMFLKLALPMAMDADDKKAIEAIKAHDAQGGGVGAPTLDIAVPNEWRDEDFSTGTPKVMDHDGRHRMMAHYEMYGDTPVETHIFFQSPNREWRTRHITPKIIERLRTGGVISQRGQLISNIY